MEGRNLGIISKPAATSISRRKTRKMNKVITKSGNEVVTLLSYSIGEFVGHTADVPGVYMDSSWNYYIVNAAGEAFELYNVKR